MSNPTGKDAIEYACHHAEQAGYEMGHHLYDNPDTVDRLAAARDHLAKAVHWLDQHDASLAELEPDCDCPRHD